MHKFSLEVSRSLSRLLLQPANELERSVHALLSAGNLSTKSIAAAEQDALAALPQAEAASRLAEVRRTRELLFRAERKVSLVNCA